MNEDLLYDALNEIDDRNIEHAASYKPKEKIFTLKKYLVTAACVVMVAVSVAAIYGFRHKPAVTPTKTASAEADTFPDIVTTEGTKTEIAPETEIAVMPDTTAGVQVAQKWEERSNISKWNRVEVNGRKYISSDYTVQYERLENVLCYAALTGKDYYSENTYKTTVTVYKIKEFSEDAFIAVRFQQDSEDKNFYVYERENYKPDTVRDLLSDTSFEEYVSAEDSQILHEVKGDFVSYVKMSAATDEAVKAFTDLLKNNPDVKSKSGEAYYDGDNHISFGFKIKNFDCHAHFNEKGRLTLSVAGGCFCFDLTKEEYDEFIEIVEKNEQGKKPLSPVTMPPTEQPGEDVTSPCYNPSEVSSTAATFTVTETFLNTQ